MALGQLRVSIYSLGFHLCLQGLPSWWALQGCVREGDGGDNEFIRWMLVSDGSTGIFRPGRPGCWEAAWEEGPRSQCWGEEYWAIWFQRSLRPVWPSWYQPSQRFTTKCNVYVATKCMWICQYMKLKCHKNHPPPRLTVCKVPLHSLGSEK